MRWGTPLLRGQWEVSSKATSRVRGRLTAARVLRDGDLAALYGTALRLLEIAPLQTHPGGLHQGEISVSVLELDRSSERGALGLQHLIGRSAISVGQLRKAAKAQTLRINKESSVIGR